MAKKISDWELFKADRLMLLVAAGLAVALMINQFLSMQQRHRDSIRQTDLYIIQLAVQKYYAINGFYPTSLEKLQGVNDKICSDPKYGGSCANPGYVYAPLAENGKSVCDNHHVFCRAYKLSALRVETSSPLVLSSY